MDRALLIQPAVIGAKPPEVSLLCGEAATILSRLASGSVDLCFSNPPVEIHVDGKARTKSVRMPVDWIAEARRVARVLAFTLHPDAMLALWSGEQEIPRPDRIVAWVIGEQARLGNAAAGVNLVLLYGQSHRVRAVPDAIVAPIGDDHWPLAKGHEAPGSLGLAYSLITALRPSSVLDPFCGSGVTLHAALLAGPETIIGIDRDPSWIGQLQAEFDMRLRGPQ